MYVILLPFQWVLIEELVHAYRVLRYISSIQGILEKHSTPCWTEILWWSSRDESVPFSGNCKVTLNLKVELIFHISFISKLTKVSDEHSEKKKKRYSPSLKILTHKPSLWRHNLKFRYEGISVRAHNFNWKHGFKNAAQPHRK